MTSSHMKEEYLLGGDGNLHKSMLSSTSFVLALLASIIIIIVVFISGTVQSIGSMQVYSSVVIDLHVGRTCRGHGIIDCILITFIIITQQASSLSFTQLAIGGIVSLRSLLIRPTHLVIIN